jgi:aspartate/methionine/tyrosine aminotransferase
MRAVQVYLDLQSGTLTAEGLYQRVAAALGPATRGLYLNTPNNPTGAVMPRAHLETLARLCAERHLWVVSDEAYEHLVFDGERHVSFASLPGMAERTVSVFTFSKSYAMTGWRMGYAVAPPPLARLMGTVLSAFTTYGVFPAAQSAGVAALRGPQDSVWAMRDAYRERRDLLLAGLAAAPVLRAPTPKGAFYAFLDVSGVRAGRDLWALVEEWLELGVAVLPGTAFGEEFTGHVRLSLATRREDIAWAAELLARRYAGSQVGR